MKSDFNKERRDLLKGACTLVGATALASIGGSVNAFAAGGATQAGEAPQAGGVPAAGGAAQAPPATRVKLHQYLVEREIPGAGNFSSEKLKGISQKSCSVLKEMGPDIQWVESYVTDDKIYCIYLAPNEEMIREHAKRGGFPANRISEVHTMIDPTTAGE
jgi:Protein of unknown function (DUF4242)